mmetsp:Transcript_80186/g.259815  ORF Transcript_80186/g.259815 Transcript_80186/m.259815 type:complete len:372 (+) Transcript_80186:96-1211(+)
MARRWWPAGAALSRGRAWPAGALAPPLLLLRDCPRARPRALPRRASRRRPTQRRPAPRLRLRSRLECERFDPHVLCLAELLCFDLNTLDYGFDLVVQPVRDNDSVPDDKNFLLRDHDDKPFCVCLDAQPVLDCALGCELVPDAPTLHNLEPKTAAHTDDPVLDDKHFLLHDHDDKLLCFRSDALRRAFGPDVPILHCLEPNFADLHDNDTVSDDKPFLQNDPNDEIPLRCSDDQHLPFLERGLAPVHDTDVPPQLMRDLQVYYKANRMDFDGRCPLGCGAMDFAGHFRSCRFVLREAKMTMRGLLDDDPCAAQFPRALDPDKMLFACFKSLHRKMPDDVSLGAASLVADVSLPPPPPFATGSGAAPAALRQ